MTTLLDNPWRLAALATGAAALAFAAALVAQFGFDMRPCPLCLWQRYPYGPGVGLGLLGLALSGRAASIAWGLAAISFLAGTGLAVFHSGVEFDWWEGLASCAAPVGGTGLASAEALLEQLKQAPTVACSDRVPFFLGLTMANWNVLVTLGIAGALAVAAANEKRAA